MYDTLTAKKIFISLSPLVFPKSLAVLPEKIWVCFTSKEDKVFLVKNPGIESFTSFLICKKKDLFLSRNFLHAQVTRYLAYTTILNTDSNNRNKSLVFSTVKSLQTLFLFFLMLKRIKKEISKLAIYHWLTEKYKKIDIGGKKVRNTTVKARGSNENW